MKNVEFLDIDHFENNFHRQKPKYALSKFIDFFWETKFDHLWSEYPEGFIDVLFPNVGYTYVINLGTPLKMQLDNEVFDIKSDAFLPRCKNVTTYHFTGNKVFGIKFKVSPVILQKSINFSEYKERLYPLAYLIDKNIINKVKEAESFNSRMNIVSAYYNSILKKYAGSLTNVDIVVDIIQSAYVDSKTSVESYASTYNISTRTLQRYFEAATSISTKKALQILRIRKALAQYLHSPAEFNCEDFGYFDHSHFYKQANDFLRKHQHASIHSLIQLVNNRKGVV